ncbi:unnamed protein product [Phaedon cochleariae]|uniref:Uncharacterized protein n=1 Tax=Phaedon cochleariae TaxID=80249 RepID=A0A9N9SLJ9_PHACE|nr:unnamed protein product [Phaedon cochleariae]
MHDQAGRPIRGPQVDTLHRTTAITTVQTDPSSSRSQPELHFCTVLRAVKTCFPLSEPFPSLTIMLSQNVLEEAKLDAMQRHWQFRRGASSSTTAFFKEVNETEDLLDIPLQNTCTDIQRNPLTKVLSCDGDSDVEFLDLQEHVIVSEEREDSLIKKEPLQLDASTIGDIPGQYTICALEPYQLPVVGVYIDKRVVPGFKYRVRPLSKVGTPSTINQCLFDNRALVLQSIGRGYSRRLTFKADENKLNDNDNYFWSDNHPEGYAFELELLSDGDKFTFFNLNREPQGTVEVLTIEEPQIEIASSLTKSGLEKRATVTFTGKVESYETGVAKPMNLSGTVVSMKAKGNSTAQIVKVINVTIKRQRCYLLPGMQKIHRRVTVRGEEINDVPTKYTMNGLEPYEIPVVGTFVDPRVIPGFCYKVRPNDRKDHLFAGRALQLLSIGMGYAKRLTFQPDSLLEPDNYLWSDNHPDGLGLEPRAVHKGMKFWLEAGEMVLGEAQVFRDDHPQLEVRMEKIKTAKGFAIQKYIHVDVMCHIRLARTGGATTENEEHLMRVSGLAVVRKEPKTSTARVIRVENVGLDSQLLLLFAQTHTELTLIPKLI